MNTQVHLHLHLHLQLYLHLHLHLHLQDYEAKFGEMEGATSTPTEEALEDPGLGQHFLITDTSGALLTPSGALLTPPPAPRAPQKAPRSKGGSKGAGGGGRVTSASGRLVRGTGDIPCDNCGRMFSSHSNKERHKREHCHKFPPLAAGWQGGQREQEEVQEVQEHSCPMEGCVETFAKSVHVKRHLTSTHGVSNPLQWMEEQVLHSSTPPLHSSTSLHSTPLLHFHITTAPTLAGGAGWLPGGGYGGGGGGGGEGAAA